MSLLDTLRLPTPLEANWVAAQEPLLVNRGHHGGVGALRRSRSSIAYANELDSLDQLQRGMQELGMGMGYHHRW